MNIALMTALIAVVALAVVVTLRSATAGKVEITLNDAIIAAIAAALTLLVSGKLSKVVVGSEGVTIETAREAILSSAARPIAQQVAQLPVVPVEQAIKGGLGELPEIVRRRVQGLDLKLGLGAYYNEQVLQTYLETLTRYDFFRYVILLTPDDKLLGMIDARRLLALLQSPGSEMNFKGLADLLNNQIPIAPNVAPNQLANLPGFVPAQDAVTKQSDKRDVLDRMEKSGRDWLPVVSPEGQLVGIVDQSRLTASMILDVTNQLQAAQTH
jgi:CBS domain